MRDKISSLGKNKKVRQGCRHSQLEQRLDFGLFQFVEDCLFDDYEGRGGRKCERVVDERQEEAESG